MHIGKNRPPSPSISCEQMHLQKQTTIAYNMMWAEVVQNTSICTCAPKWLCKNIHNILHIKHSHDYIISYLMIYVAHWTSIPTLSMMHQEPSIHQSSQIIQSIQSIPTLSMMQPEPTGGAVQSTLTSSCQLFLVLRIRWSNSWIVLIVDSLKLL